MASRPIITPAPITYIKAACHCGLNEFRAGFPTSALPISNDLCHCSSCRHSSGQMAVYHVNTVSLLCADTDEPFHVDGNDGSSGDLVAYRTSENGLRYFCSVCSAHMIFRYLGTPKEGGEGGEREGGFWCVAAGTLERTEGIVQVGYHIWVEDTLDGGLSEHLRAIDDVKLPRYRRGPGSEQLPLGWQAESLTQDLSLQDGPLHFSCHCGTLQFKITRPNFQSSRFHATFPDLLHPHDTTHLAKLRNSGDVKWWLRPLGSYNPQRYLAGHCACPDCRLTSGFELQSGAYVPIINILDQNGHPITLGDPGNIEPRGVPNPTMVRMEGLKQYISSPGRYREFCKNCGATAFAWHARHPDLICVAVGLVQERFVGARAELWFEWCLSRVGFMEQALDPRTMQGLAAGLKEMSADSPNSRGVVGYSDSPKPLTPVSEEITASA